MFDIRIFTNGTFEVPNLKGLLSKSLRELRKIKIVHGNCEVVCGGSRTYKESKGTDAGFQDIYYMTSDKTGNLFVADSTYKVIRRVDIRNEYTTHLVAGVPKTGGKADGPFLSATFSSPRGMVFDSKGNMLVNDAENGVIRRLDFGTSTVSTLAVKIGRPLGLSIDSLDNLYVCDQTQNKVVKISPTGEMLTLMGTSEDAISKAKLSYAWDVSVDFLNGNNVFVADDTGGFLYYHNTAAKVATPVKEILPPSASLAGICYDHETGMLYVVESGSSRLFAIHWETKQFKDYKIKSDTTVLAIAKSPFKDCLYVSDRVRIYKVT